MSLKSLDLIAIQEEDIIPTLIQVAWTCIILGLISSSWMAPPLIKWAINFLSHSKFAYFLSNNIPNRFFPERRVRLVNPNLTGPANTSSLLALLNLRIQILANPTCSIIQSVPVVTGQYWLIIKFCWGTKFIVISFHGSVKQICKIAPGSVE